MASTCNFYDVTQGDMDVNCTGVENCYTPSGLNGVLSTSEDPFPSAPGISLGFTLSTETSAVSLQELNVNRMKAYGTGPGWDFATGIGTVNGYNLVMNSNW